MAFCDAPRAWYEEATTRILNMGKGSIVQHPLDACLFLAFDRQVHPPPPEGAEAPRLIALFGTHVDDIFGCYYENDEHTTVLLQNLKGIFNFREWITSNDKEELEYCGAQITKVGQDHWKIHHEKYLNKQKPITYPKERHGSNDEVTDREKTSLRGLIGALQWPATQTSPHLQCMVSTLAGQVSKGTTSTLDAANKCLKFAKQNNDVGLEFRHLGPKEEITFIAYSDASFASRDDLSSQGGYMVAMTHQMSPKVEKDTTTSSTGGAGSWREWREAHLQQRARQHPTLPMRFCLPLRFGDFYGNLGCPWTTSRPPNVPTLQSWLLMPRRCMTCWSEMRSKQEAVLTSALPLRFWSPKTNYFAAVPLHFGLAPNFNMLTA